MHYRTRRPAGIDDQQIHPLNKSWRILSEADIDLGSGWRRRLRKLVWDLIGPILQRQERFNAVLVEHVNRNHPGTSSSRTSVSGVIAAFDNHLEALAAFHSRLIQYLQQITLYVDTKDRREAGQLRDELSRMRQGLAAGLDSVTDEFRMRLESALVSDHRMAADIESVRNSTRQGFDDLAHKRSAEEIELRQRFEGLAAGLGVTDEFRMRWNQRSSLTTAWPRRSSCASGSTTWPTSARRKRSSCASRSHSSPPQRTR